MGLTLCSYFDLHKLLWSAYPKASTTNTLTPGRLKSHLNNFRVCKHASRLCSGSSESHCHGESWFVLAKMTHCSQLAVKLCKCFKLTGPNSTNILWTPWDSYFISCFNGQRLKYRKRTFPSPAISLGLQRVAGTGQCGSSSQTIYAFCFHILSCKVKWPWIFQPRK